MRSGTGILVLLVATISGLYATGAGKTVMAQLNTLEGGCYTGLTKLGGTSVAQPTCSAFSAVIDFVNAGDRQIKRMAASVRSMIDTSNGGLEQNIELFGKQAMRLASSQQELHSMFQRGPYNNAGNLRSQFQLAVDSFAIGNSYLSSRTTSSLAIPWLAQGAMQPQGYGLMSQLTLAQMYSTGTGVPVDVRQAKDQFLRAKQSLGILMNTNDPDAKRLLQTLPVSPNAMAEQIDRALRDLEYRPEN